MITDPPVVVILPNFNPYIVEVGDNKTLSCSVTEANPSAIVSIVWSGKGTGSTATITLPNIQKADEGTYTCIANNGITGAVSVSKTVLIACEYLIYHNLFLCTKYTVANIIRL